jgi:hypothetical protein
MGVTPVLYRQRAIAALSILALLSQRYIIFPPTLAMKSGARRHEPEADYANVYLPSHLQIAGKRK